MARIISDKIKLPMESKTKWALRFRANDDAMAPYGNESPSYSAEKTGNDIDRAGRDSPDS